MKIGFVISIVLFLGLTISYQSVIGGERKVLKKLEKANFSTKDIFISFKGEQLRVVQTGNPDGGNLVFIHGSPGDWTAWKDVIVDSTLQQEYNMILVDKPGYGKTTLNAETTLVEQSKGIEAIIKSLKLENIILVSHSYGGGVAEQVLIDYPEKIKHNIFISPTLSPDLQHPKWYNKVGRRLKFMLSRDLRSSNIEMWGLDSCLLNNECKIKDIKTPITFFHGEKDWLVPIETVEYFQKFSTSQAEYIILPEESHFILWTQPGMVINEILKIK